MGEPKHDEQRATLERLTREACRAGAYEEAATLLVRELGEEVLAFLIGLLRSRIAAEEAFSMVMERLWRGLPSFEWRSSVRTWVFVLARNTALSALREGGRRDRKHVPLSQVQDLPPALEHLRRTTLACQRTEVKDRMRELRESLPERDQTLIVLRVDQQLPWRELAWLIEYEGGEATERELDLASAALRRRFYKVKARLREQAEREGLIPPSGTS